MSLGSDVKITNENEPLNLKKDDYNNLIKQLIESGVISNNDWLEQDKLLASDGASDDLFGMSVSIDGDYVIIGAMRDDDNGNNSGSAYIFKRTGTTWTQEAKLLASDGAVDDRFGVSVSIDGDYVIIGAMKDDDNGAESGSAYIFKRTGTTWTQDAKLLASDGADWDYFGWSVSIDGDYAIIGANSDDDNGNNSGSAYIFKRTGTTWTQEAKLLASDGAVDDRFGMSVSIDGDYAIIGAFHKDDNIGSAYIFKHTGTTWTEEQKLLASDGAVDDRFGVSVSISGNCAIAGADGEDTFIGSAYIFKRTDTTWTQEAKLLASDGEFPDCFGYSVSISGNRAIIGALGDDTFTGSAYVFSRVNHPPNIPVIGGPNSGKPGTSYDFTFNAVDPDGDYVRYIINWGDTTSNTTIFAPSGTNITVSHTWTTKGEYIITAKAEDEFGLIGPEATKTVTMPRNRATYNLLFLWFLGRFPILQKILSFIL